jgi:hypothetical protein
MRYPSPARYPSGRRRLPAVQHDVFLRSGLVAACFFALSFALIASGGGRRDAPPAPLGTKAAALR